MRDATVIFPYIQIGSTHRPIIPIYVRHAQTTIEYHVLVDSGADFNVFHTDLARILGMNPTSTPPQHLTGIGGSTLAYPVTLDIGLDEQELLPRVPVLLSPARALEGYGIVGQAGFFEHFIVEFTAFTHQLALTPRPQPPAPSRASLLRP